MEESTSSIAVDGRVTGIRFHLATAQEICTSSNSDCPINHASQLSNPFLGLPLQTGKCESCGTAEPGQCEGHFGYIELPIPIYHPCHVSELKRMLSLICLKCLKMKNSKIKNIGIVEGALASCCPETSQISINEVKTTDGPCYLELKLSSKSRLQDGFWNFLERYGFRFGDDFCRSLLPSEVMAMLRKMPEVTRKKLAGKGYFPQDGYILQYLPVPPNCLSVPDISDGITVTSSDLTIAMLKKVLKQVEIIKGSRSGTPNFESHKVEANDLQAAVLQYLQVRGTAKSPRDVDMRYGISKEINNSSTKAWLEKMKTLFIRKGSGFSSRSVITGDPYKRVDEIGLPFEIAQMITFEERVNQNNINRLQKLVDEKLCLTYKDGFTTYSLREGSKGHTFLRPGQVVHRRIMDGDLVFVNRPPTTHKHSLQALSVYVHEDHTVKINPLICGPLSADFDGDCVHLFYPQSLAAKAEVLELFSVENQLLSSHSGNLNLQMATDSILSVKMMFKNHFLNRASAQQLAMFVSYHLPKPALLKAYKSGPLWTALEILQTSLPSSFDCSGERHLICQSEILKIDYNRDIIQSVIAEILTSVFAKKGPHEVLKFFNALQPLLMENLFSEGFSVSLEDFNIPTAVIENIQKDIQDISPLLFHLRSTYNELVALQLENHLRVLKIPITNFILKFSAMGNLIDSKSDSAITKVVQQIGFLGVQLSDKGKFYSKTLVGDMASLFQNKYPFGADHPAEEFGLVRSCLFHGLDPYQEMVHSIYSREIIVRSSRGLTEPGTLFKNLMAILRDVVICYDGTVRNVCSNAVIQFEYGIKDGTKPQSFFAAGEPVGVLAATAMSNPAYKAVLDSSPSSNSSWEMMKEILLCAVNFKNDLRDRRVILYLNDCDCGRKYCPENAAHLVKNQLKKVSLKDTAVEFLIEYNRSQTAIESSDIDAGLVGHIHLNKIQLKDFNISMPEVVEKCQETINLFRKKKKVGNLFKRIIVSYSECCSFQQSCESKWSDMPCLKFSWQDMNDHHLERTSHLLANTICPVLLETIVKGDPRVCMANIIWITPDRTTWIRNSGKSQKGELALDVVLEREAVKQSGDAWRIVLDSCLPVLHLIDTKRSIPYAIKQVQELLGISCAFEQAIQRLSTSVTMVAKGVLKEHLILLANSMTCAGSLVGFNMGGIKALSRALNVQVPFTEATLFTPKKCFERAAEKCHVDRLSSIVASCAWGKHVAVGTGSRFEVLWNTKEVELNQEEGTDVYSFLHLVRGSSNGEQPSSACLGAEIDYLDSEAEDAEMGLSPEHNSSLEKPTFEDSADFEFDLGNQKLDGNKPSESNWGRAQTQNVESVGGGDWVVDKKPNPKPGGWSGWGNATVQTDDIPSTKEQENSLRTGGWNGIEPGKDNQSAPWAASGKKADEAEQTGWNKRIENNSSGFGGWNAMEPAKENQSSSWAASGKKANEAEEAGWNRRTEKNSSGSGGWNGIESAKENQSASWAASGKKANEAEETGWTKRIEKNSSGGGGWNATESGKQNQSASWAASGKKVNEAEETGWNNRTEKNSSGVGGWNATASGKENQSASWAASGKKANEAEETGWTKRTEQNSSGVGGWNATESGKENQSASWAASGTKVKEAEETGWNKTTGKNSSGFGGWNAMDSGKEGNQLESWADRGNKVEEDNATGWSGKGGRVESWKGGNQTESRAVWGKKKVEEADTVWSKKDGNMESGKEGNESGSWASWGKKVEVAETLPNKDGRPQLDRPCDLSTSTGVLPERAQEESPRSSGWNASNKQSQWGPQKQGGNGGNESDIKSQWGSQKQEESPRSSGWNASNKQSQWGPQKHGGDGGNESDINSQWGSQQQGVDGGNENNVQWGHQKRGNSRGWGSSNSGDWKTKGNRPPPKSVGGFNDDSSPRPAFTATRQRLDIFESAEHDVLLDVEQIMLSIRRIMHQSGYNDGDPLSGDDQKYILDNVFNHHPDKAAKMGAGVDYVMVNKHSSFQESRCFYIVSTDGHQEDFSYRKSLENYVRGKYPETAESFVGKYFKKPRSAGNLDRSPLPGLDRSPFPAPDRSPLLPAPDRSPLLPAPDRSPLPEEAGPENRQ